jgi:hypothetical protein
VCQKLSRTIKQSIKGGGTNDDDALYHELQVEIEAEDVHQIEGNDQN